MSHGNLRFLAALAFAAPAAAPLRAQSTVEAITLLQDVHTLSDDRMGGRLIGSPGADSAAVFIARRFAEAGLQASPRGWYQNFTVAKDAPAAPHSKLGGAAGRNVIGVLPGRDPSLRNQIVIVGAHYDHLGLGGFGSLDPDSTGHIHNGADDNASGIASLIHIAGHLALAPTARTVVFIAFSGEEEGLLGSEYYVRNPLYALTATYAMVNLDMVGRLKNNRLIIYGSATAREFPPLLDSLNAFAQFDLKQQGDGFGPSDHSSFYGAGVPVLHLFTDLHEDYHRTTDDWEKINADGLARVADFTVELVSALGNRSSALTYVSAPPMSAATTAVTPGYGAYLGTIPDMTDNPGGVRITGVRAGSPAASAGLQRDDIITRIGNMEVPDLQTMTDALRSHRPGDVVEIRIMRDGVEQRLKATLGTRGG